MLHNNKMQVHNSGDIGQVPSQNVFTYNESEIDEHYTIHPVSYHTVIHTNT